MSTGKDRRQQPATIGDNVQTLYGKGRVVSYREEDSIYGIELPGALLYTGTRHVPLTTSSSSSMELNVAYEALEKMRRLNLQMKLFEKTGNDHVDFTQCTSCLLQDESSHRRFPRLQRLVDGQETHHSNTQNTRKVFPRIQRALDERQRSSASPCLICASPTCSTHASSTFAKEHISLCQDCERLFELDFIVECVSDPSKRDTHVHHMIDLYDRSLLLLRYSSQYIESVSAALEKSTEQQNKIGLGSSGVGVVSGALGIAAAATILTPVGPPLMVASLLFGGGATAVQTGTQVINYHSEPNKVADRIIALYGINKSILRVTSTLRDAVALRDRRNEPPDRNILEELHRSSDSPGRATGVLTTTTKVGQSLTLGGANMTSSAVTAGAEVGVLGGTRSATALSRSATAAARTLRFARFAGGALSAAVIVMEANAIQSTIQKMRAGNPCDKAETLRKIQEELADLTPTEDLDSECQSYLDALVVEALPKLADDGTCARLSEPGAMILDGKEEDGDDDGPQLSPRLVSSSKNDGLSLLERIQLHKLRESGSLKFDDVDDDLNESQQGRGDSHDLDLALVT